jgi:small conductance mechanosensitive channel
MINPSIIEFLKEYRQLAIIIIIISLAVVMARLLGYVFKKYLDDASEKLKIDPTRYKFYRNAIDVIVFILAGFSVIYSIPELRTIGATLFAGAGILAAIIGFASQQAFSNIVGGIFIVIFKPFRVNDLIKVGNNPWGFVEDITLRHTVIRSFENRRYIIPNSVIGNETILNSSIVDERANNMIEFSVSYDSNIDEVFKILKEEAEKHPLFIDVRTEEEKLAGIPSVDTRVLALTDCGVTIRLSVWTNNHIAGFDLKCDLLKSVKERFDAAHIEIPFPYRTLIIKNEEAEKAGITK